MARRIYSTDRKACRRNPGMAHNEYHPDKTERKTYSRSPIRFFLQKQTMAGLFCVFILASAAWAGLKPVDLTQTPMFSKVSLPPANIMVLLDDSGSMTWEILVKGRTGGLFPKTTGNDDGYAFVFDNPGDDLNVSSSSWDYLNAEGRKYWKSQYHEVNALYYNPGLNYVPWPSYGNVTFANADPDTPRVHPVRYSTNTLNLDSTSFSVDIITPQDVPGDQVSIPHAHYFAFSSSESTPYLVVMDGGTNQIRYFKVTLDQGTDFHEKVSALTEETIPPSEIITGRTYAEERQNFANWFSYYRRREFIAKGALGEVFQGIDNVRVGIYGINQKVVQPLKKVKITENNQVVDEVDTLLEDLYDYVSNGGTPLNAGLNTVGKYFETNDGKLGTVSGTIKPYGNNNQGGACQQSFTIIVTDGYYTDPGSVNIGGNLDDNNDTSKPYKNWGGGEHPYADQASNSLADIAFYYYANDLNTTLDNKLPVSQFDSAKHQHMVTFAVAFGVNGTLDPGDYTDTLHHNTTGNPIQWPTVASGQTPQTIDDLWHATVNGRGRFKSARNPIQLAGSLIEFMNSIVEISGASSSSVAVNGDWLFGKLKSDTLVFQATYSNKDEEWTGDIKAYELDPVTGLVQTGSVKWSAADKLSAKDWDKRVIATYSGSAGIPFAEGNLSSDQKTQLGANPEEMVKYLRGYPVQNYRQRTSKLGDSVNARPVYVDDILYVGANDGMLHAFDAVTGEELFAYVPNLVFPDLKELADPGYDHRYYVDLTPTVKKAVGILGGANSDTLLVGGLRRGGKGYFALKLNDAKNIVSETDLAQKVLWEYPKTPDPDMGYSYGIPTIVKSNSTLHPWIVIFSNGYNSDNGSAVLYVLDAVTGAVVKAIDTKAIPAANETANGLSTPVAIDVNFDQKADFVYAGDLYGNLWKFDLSFTNPVNWSVAFGSVSDPKPLFQARGPNGEVQPITTKPDVMYHPKEHGLMVCFGTGKFLGLSDFSNTDVQTIYGVWDYGDTIYNLTSNSWSTDDNNEYLGSFDRSTGALTNQPNTVGLLKQTFNDYDATFGGQLGTYRVFSKGVPDWITMPDASDQEDDLSDSQTNHAGYYIDLAAGEQVVTDVLIRGGLLYVIGFKPDSGSCSSGGASMFMELNAFNGGNLAEIQFDLNNDNSFTKDDQVDTDNDSNTEKLENPSGILMDGQAQLPAFLRLDNNRERLYISGTGGGSGGGSGDPTKPPIDDPIVQRAPKLGVTYWMQIFE